MRNILLVLSVTLLIAACANRITSPIAEKVTLYKDERAIPASCERLGEVKTGVCANTTPCPAEVMKKNLREKAFTEYDADAVWLVNTTLSGTEVVGYGIAYRCK